MSADDDTQDLPRADVLVFGDDGRRSGAGGRGNDAAKKLRRRPAPTDTSGWTATSPSGPLKIARVPRRWRDRRADDITPSRLVLDEPLAVDLIEPPIHVR